MPSRQSQERELQASGAKSNKSNSVSRSIRTFLGLQREAELSQTKQASGQHSTYNDRTWKSTSETASKLPSSKQSQLDPKSKTLQQQVAALTKKTFGSSSLDRETKTNSRRSSAGGKVKKGAKKDFRAKQRNQADQFYKELLIRRHFCTWIERFIEAIKLQRGQVRLQSEAERSKSGKSGPSDLSGTSHLAENIQPDASRDRAMRPEASRSSMPVSQGFFDEVVSLSSNSAALVNKHVFSAHLDESQPPQLVQVDSTNHNTLRELQSNGESKSRSKKESFSRNVEHKGNESYENCFVPQHMQAINAFRNQRQTRNLSVFSGNAELKQTAQLGGELFGQEGRGPEHDEKHNLQRALAILRKFDDKRKRPSASTSKQRRYSKVQASHSKSQKKSRSKSRSKSKSRKRSGSNSRSASKDTRRRSKRSKSGSKTPQTMNASGSHNGAVSITLSTIGCQKNNKTQILSDNSFPNLLN